MLREMSAKFTNGRRTDTVNAVQIAIVDLAEVLDCAHTRRKQGFGNNDVHTCGTHSGEEFLNSLPVCGKV